MRKIYVGVLGFALITLLFWSASALAASRNIGTIVSAGASVNNSTTAAPFVLTAQQILGQNRVQISCTVATNYRMGPTAAVAALVSDAPVPANTLFDVGTVAGLPYIAVIPTAGGADTCQVYTLPADDPPASVAGGIASGSVAALSGLNLGSGGTTAMAGQLVINPGNVTNQVPLLISNNGLGTTGIQIQTSGYSDTFDLGIVGGGTQSRRIASANRGLEIYANSAPTYDTNVQAIYIGSFSAASRPAVRIDGSNGQTADLLQLTANGNNISNANVLTSFSSTGAMTTNPGNGNFGIVMSNGGIIERKNNGNTTIAYDWMRNGNWEFLMPNAGKVNWVDHTEAFTRVTFDEATGNITAAGLNPVPIVHVGQTSNAVAIEFGDSAATSGVLPVTFATAFSVAPVCNCTGETSLTAGCSISTVATTTGVSFTVSGLGTGKINWICMGAK